METTLITGASSGIGHSLARRLAHSGDAVVLFARRTEPLQALAAEINAVGGRALAVAGDVTVRDSLSAAVAAAEAELGPITRLVANAGGGTPTFVDAYDAKAIEDVIALNLIGVVNSIHAVLPGMLARRRGHLVAMASLAGRRALPTGAAYGAAKAGVIHFMESLRIDLRGRGVDITLLIPDFVDNTGQKRRQLLRLPLETATTRMAAAIQARRRTLILPRRLGITAALLGLLPSRIYDRVMAGRGRGRRHTPASAQRKS